MRADGLPQQKVNCSGLLLRWLEHAGSMERQLQDLHSSASTPRGLVPSCSRYQTQQACVPSCWIGAVRHCTYMSVCRSSRSACCFASHEWGPGLSWRRVLILRSPGGCVVRCTDSEEHGILSDTMRRRDRVRATKIQQAPEDSRLDQRFGHEDRG